MKLYSKKSSKGGSQTVTLDEIHAPPHFKNQPLYFDFSVDSQENDYLSALDSDEYIRKFQGGEFNKSDPTHVQKLKELCQLRAQQEKELEKLRQLVSKLQHEYETISCPDDSESPSIHGLLN